jgi:hypothetical protein
VVGSRISAAAVAAAAERLTGYRYTRTSLGTVDELRARIADARARGAGLEDWIGDVYWLFMVTGVTAVRDPQNGRYPDITPQSLDDVVAQTLHGTHES